MGSRKRSARAKEISQFKSQLELGNLFNGENDIFAQEERRREERVRDKEAALRKKSCESKNRYMSRYDAEAAIASCAEHGTTGLHCYKCEYCNGWHLTSHPQK